MSSQRYYDVYLYQAFVFEFVRHNDHFEVSLWTCEVKITYNLKCSEWNKV